MNRQRDIFDFFRDNQHQFDERPSPRAWRRLERRLEAHQRRGRRSLYRSLSMVAGVLAIVALIVLLSVLVDQRPADRLTGTPPQLEDLHLPESDATAYRVVEFTRSYQDRMSRPIEEGGADKRLVPMGKK